MDESPDAEPDVMGNYRTRRIDRDTAEQLLRGVPGGPLSGNDPLVRLLAATRAPGRADELSGEQAAVAAFQRAEPAAPPRASSTVRKTLAKLATLKVAAILAATTMGGVALAASTGALPSPLRDSVDASSSEAPVLAPRPSTDATAGPGAAGSGPSGTAGAAAGTNAGGPNAGPSATDGPSMVGLCRAYSSGQKADHGNSLNDPAFADLIVTAGGQDKVDGFCGQVLSSAPGNGPGDDPSGKPGNEGGDGQTEHPGGKPTEHPGEKPTEHPGGNQNPGGKSTGHPGGGLPTVRPGH